MQRHFCSLSAGAFKLLLGCAMGCASPVQRWKKIKTWELARTAPSKPGNFQWKLMEIDVWVCILLILKITMNEFRMNEFRMKNEFRILTEIQQKTTL